MQRRRAATSEELQQGMEEMKQAQERLEREVREGEELPLEDVKGEVVEEEGEKLRLEDAPQRPPEKVEGKDERAHPSQPNTSPAAITPARPGSVASASAIAKSGESRHEVNVKTPVAAAKRKELEDQKPPALVPVSGMGRDSVNWTAAQTPFSQPMASPESVQPLFTEEQVQQLALLHSRAPWLYQERPRTFFPHIRRPSFLESEEARINAESEELVTMRPYMKDLIAQNEMLAKRIQVLEAGFAIPEAELSFSTPNGSQKMEDSKEAARPPEAPKEAARPPEVFKEAARPPEAPKEAARPPEVSKEAARPPEAPKEAARPPEVSKDAEMSGERKEPKDPTSGEAQLPGHATNSAAGSTGFAEKSMEFMLLMMENMKEMNRRLQEEKEEGGSIRGIETVRSGLHELPGLPQWNQAQAPLQLSDWLLLIAPVISDLSATAETWWNTVVTESESWYQAHMLLSPLERLKHGTNTPSSLSLEKWQRLERRVATMMLQAVPEHVREELVASRKLTVFAIVTHLYVLYCPGGITEKQNLLKNLEEPPEVNALSEAPMALRRWLRWRQRATEIGATTPDPSLLVRGLLKMTRKVLESHRELQFRISLARHGLGIDTVPTLDNVTQFAMHLLSECEQLSQVERKPSNQAIKGEVKLKALDQEKEDAAKGKGKGKDRSSEEEKAEKPKTKCRKNTSESPPKQKVAKAEGDASQGGGKNGEEQNGDSDSMKGLIEEANKMLRTLTASSSAAPSSSASTSSKDEDSRTEVLSRLQAQLNSLKTFKLARMTKDLNKGLIDSGATHPLRPMKVEEEKETMKEVEVALADGKCIRLHMTSTGTMITEDQEVEPIACLAVEDCGGCPQIPRKLSLELISEIEDERRGVSISRIHFEEEVHWMNQLIAVHPILSKLPEWLKRRLVVDPTDWNLLPVNRRQRRTLQQNGVALHLYSGDDQGYTLRRSVKSQGGREKQLLEIDKKQGASHDMLKDVGVYSSLLRVALEGKLLSVVGAPNCRSRSVLRHRPIPGQPDAPRPIRCWQGGEFGAPWITAKEEALLREDDVLLWRMLFLFMVAEYTRRAQLRPHPVQLVIEQPASPKAYAPEVVSFWDTKEWQSLRTEFQLKEVTFNQGDHGGLAPKPTTLGTTFDLCMEDFQRPPQQLEVTSSKQLERWAPGLMDAVGAAIIKEVFKQQPQLKALTFEEHVAFGHVPYRRDCAVCQMASQQNFPHRRIKHPQSGVLSLDTGGPFFPANDVGGWKSRYFLAGAYTYMVPKDTQKMKEPPQEEEDLEGAPALDAEEEEEEGGESRWVAEDQQPTECLPPVGMVRVEPSAPRRPPPNGPEEDGGESRKTASEGQSAERLPPVGMVKPSAPSRPPPEDQEEERPRDEDEPEDAGKNPAEEEVKEELEMRVFKLALPLRSKKAKEVTRVAMEMILKLKLDGYQVSRVHSDRGHEFLGTFETWMKSRGIVVTKTSGDDPKANGRAETTVKAVYLNEVYRCQRLDKAPDFPLFLQDVLVRRRRWKKEAFEPTVEVTKYLGPAPEENGHWIKPADEPPRVTRCFMRKALERPDEGVWLAIEREVLDALAKRRRIRGKTAVRRAQVEEKVEDEEEEEVARVAKMRAQFVKVVEEETKMMLEDDQSLVSEEIEILAGIKKILDAQEKSDDDEVLQTKIISLQEVSKKWSEWIEAVDAEVRSLLEEKEAMEEVSGKRLEELLQDAEARGVQVEFLPSKLVCTKKPGKRGGRHKIRWVICGNFEQVKEGENTFSSGADAAALRLLIVAASRFQWSAGTLDIKTAFLNACMDPDAQPSLLLVKPPPILLEKKYMKPGTYYMPKRAVYGLRRSPKLWGDCRDDELHRLKVPVSEDGQALILRLYPLDSEPNLWRIAPEECPDDHAPLPLKGLLMTYVDDLLVAGSSAVVQAVMSCIRGLWTASDPDEVGIKPIRSLGVEISKVFDPKRGREVWYVGQQSYIKDLLAQDEGEVLERKIPITKDQSQFVPEEDITQELIKLAQKATGEMLWLVTRTRADLMYPVAKMGSNITKSPRRVLQIYQQIKGYLKRTINSGLCFDAAGPETVMIEAFSDASFAPDGDVSHGAFLIQVAGCLVFWRSGRQSFVTLSTAESEMMEVIESMVAGESIGAVADEIFGELCRKSWTDSQSALAILTTDGGSWRTRHLRLRAAAARQSITQGSWFIQHLAGNHMTADIGTKALASERIKILKEEMHMADIPQVEEIQKESEEKKVKEKGPEPEEKKEMNIKAAASVLKLLTLAAAMSVAKGEEDEEKEKDTMMEFNIMMAAFTALIIAVTLFGQWLWKTGRERMRNRRPVQSGSAGRSTPEGVERKGKGKEKGGESRETAYEGQSTERLPPVGMARVEPSAPLLPPPSGEEPGEASPVLLPPMSEPSSDSFEEPPYRPLDERHIPEIDIEGELRRIAEEEAILYDEARRDPERFSNYERSDEDSQPLFRVWTTRYGSVLEWLAEYRWHLWEVQLGHGVYEAMPLSVEAFRVTKAWASGGSWQEEILEGLELCQAEAQASSGFSTAWQMRVQRAQELLLRCPVAENQQVETGEFLPFDSG
eukprot:s5129_g2.t1